jgi:hypothetical protein
MSSFVLLHRGIANWLAEAKRLICFCGGIMGPSFSQSCSQYHVCRVQDQGLKASKEVWLQVKIESKWERHGHDHYYLLHKLEIFFYRRHDQEATAPTWYGSYHVMTPSSLKLSARKTFFNHIVLEFHLKQWAHWLFKCLDHRHEFFFFFTKVTFYFV